MPDLALVASDTETCVSILGLCGCSQPSRDDLTLLRCSVDLGFFVVLRFSSDPSDRKDLSWQTCAARVSPHGSATKGSRSGTSCCGSRRLRWAVGTIAAALHLELPVAPCGRSGARATHNAPCRWAASWLHTSKCSAVPVRPGVAPCCVLGQCRYAAVLDTCEPTDPSW